MKIAVIADPLDRQYAGPRTVTLEIVRALSQLDSISELVLVRPSHGGEFQKSHEIVIPIHARVPGASSRRLFFDIPRALTAANVDLVVEPAHFGPFNLPKHIKRVTFIYDITPILFPQFHLKTSALLHRLFLPRIIHKASHLITCSEHSRRDIINHFPDAEHKTTSVHLGACTPCLDSLRPVPTPVDSISGPFFLYVGTIEPRKNLPCLLDAFEQFKDKHHSNHQLVIAGKEGWKTSRFFGKLRSHRYRSDIFQLGYVPNTTLQALYRSARCFVYPSFYEGFGLPVVDAMAHGLPVIVAQSSSLLEVGGAAALYFNPQSPTELANHLETLAFNDTAHRERCRLSEQQAAQFSWDTFGKTVASLIQQVAKHG